MVSEGKTREIFVTFPDIIHSFYARAKTKMENYLCSNGKIRGRLTLIAENIIQGLERERSTKELIEKICRKIDLTVDENIIEQALPYLELRHKLVHADGKVDPTFQEQYPMFSYNGSEIVLNYTLISKATSRVSDLVLAIDESARNKGILSSQ